MSHDASLNFRVQRRHGSITTRAPPVKLESSGDPNCARLDNCKGRGTDCIVGEVSPGCEPAERDCCMLVGHISNVHGQGDTVPGDPIAEIKGRVGR
jgi:hypothetical protein